MSTRVLDAWLGLMEWARFEEGASPPTIAGVIAGVTLVQTSLGRVNGSGICRRGATDEAKRKGPASVAGIGRHYPSAEEDNQEDYRRNHH